MRYTFIDLDDCVHDGEIDLWAQCVLARFKGKAYAELSVSGTGIHIICRAYLPPGGRRRGRVEMYDQGRFAAMTGRVLPSWEVICDCQAEVEALHREVFPQLARPSESAAPRQPVSESDSELIERAHRARNGAKFWDLWRGNLAGYTSQSEADLALCSMLVYWAGRDPARVDALFRQSSLYRPKWDRRCRADGQTYGEATIEKAVRT